MEARSRSSRKPDAETAPSGLDAANLRTELAQSNLFRGLDAATFDMMVQSASSRYLQPGQILVRQGEEPSAIYMVVSGGFKLSHCEDGKQLTIRYAGPGDLIGCAAVFGGIPYLATALAVLNNSLLAWTASDMHALLARDSQLTCNALIALGQRVEDMLLCIREMSSGPAQQRIARAIVRLAARLGRTTARGVEIGVPLSRSDIAEMAGTTHFTVSRVLSDWDARGLVRSGRCRVVVLDPARLHKVAVEA